jgi:hypothetical protein
MKVDRLILAIIKSVLCMAGIFLIGYLGYHYPDVMIWVIVAAVLFAFSWYFYAKESGD